jgi:hypothetical protein
MHHCDMAIGQLSQIEKRQKAVDYLPFQVKYNKVRDTDDISMDVLIVKQGFTARNCLLAQGHILQPEGPDGGGGHCHCHVSSVIKCVIRSLLGSNFNKVGAW